MAREGAALKKLFSNSHRRKNKIKCQEKMSDVDSGKPSHASIPPWVGPAPLRPPSADVALGAHFQWPSGARASVLETLLGDLVAPKSSCRRSCHPVSSWFLLGAGAGGLLPEI